MMLMLIFNQGNTALIVASKHKSQLIVMELLHNTALHSVLPEDFTDAIINIVKLLLSDKTNLEKKRTKRKNMWYSKLKILRTKIL